MIPIRDDNPAHRRSWVTWLIVAACAYVFFFLQPSQEQQALEFTYRHATIPCEILTGEPLTVDEIRTDTCDARPADPVFPSKSLFESLVASLFMHGSLGHLVGNLWVLLIFGNNVEDRMGHFGYAVFYLIGGLLASAVHIVANPSSTVPVVGASGAIAAVMGSYLVLFPGARVVSIIPPFIFWPFRVPAVVFLLIWFVGQFALAGQESTIAWEAHAGGFLVGMAYTALRRRSFRGRW